MSPSQSMLQACRRANKSRCASWPKCEVVCSLPMMCRNSLTRTSPIRAWPSVLGYALEKPLQFPPGIQYHYSNTNTVLLGLAVEKQSGQTLADYISEHILAPLKLTHTNFPTTAAFPSPHPQGYTAVEGTARTATDWNPSWAWAAGNMISKLDDMRIWAGALAPGALL